MTDFEIYILVVLSVVLLVLGDRIVRQLRNNAALRKTYEELSQSLHELDARYASLRQEKLQERQKIAQLQLKNDLLQQKLQTIADVVARNESSIDK